MTAPECPFCHLAEDRIWLQTHVAVAFLDQFPVSPGHTLIIICCDGQDLDAHPLH
jgi:diadenosine tetraphosphate (Ap4A) HIT family hydrolase